MKKKQTNYECIVLCSNTEDYSKVKKAKDAGWRVKHYKTVSKNGGKVKFTQEVYWYDREDQYGDLCHHKKVLEAEGCSSKDFSKIATEIAYYLNKDVSRHCFRKNFLGNGELRAIEKITHRHKKVYVHLWVLTKGTREEPKVDPSLEQAFNELFSDSE